MNKKRLLAAFLVVFAVIALGAYDLIYFPLFQTDVDGIRFEWVFNIATDLTSDTWLLGDTTAAGMFVTEQPIEIVDVKIFGDPDSGDTCNVVIYSASSGTGVAEVAAQSDSLCGTTWAFIDGCTPSSTYKVITPTEGLAIMWNHIAGSPNSVKVVVVGKYKIKDALE